MLVSERKRGREETREILRGYIRTVEVLIQRKCFLRKEEGIKPPLV